MLNVNACLFTANALPLNQYLNIPEIDKYFSQYTMYSGIRSL